MGAESKDKTIKGEPTVRHKGLGYDGLLVEMQKLGATIRKGFHLSALSRTKLEPRSKGRKSPFDERFLGLIVISLRIGRYRTYYHHGLKSFHLEKFIPSKILKD